MVKNTCEVCGYQSQRKDIKKFDIFPSAVMRKVGKLQGKETTLCNNCHEEFEELCLKMVADMTFDTNSKRFRAKSPQKMVKEYEMAYQRFVRYKQHQKNG